MSSNSRNLRSSGSTSAVSLDKTKTYKFDSTGALVEATSIGDTDILFSGSKSSLRRIADLERNVSILAAKALTTDAGNNEDVGQVEYAVSSGKWKTARTLSLTGAVTGSASVDGSGNVSLATTATSDPVITLTGDVTGSGTMTNLGNVSIAATIAANSVALGTDTTGNYMVNVSAGTGISVSHTQGEGSTATISSTITQYTDALARAALSTTAGSGAYNSTTGVITIPTNTNQLTNGAGFVTSSGVTSVATGNGLTGGTITGTGTLSMSGSYTGTFTVTGDIRATGEVTAYYSDGRLKTNLQKIDGALDKVMALNGYTYDSNELAEELGLKAHFDQIGLLAQEVEAVMPQLVTDSALEGYKTIRYDKVVSILVNAIKEQQAQIEELQAVVKKTLH